MELEGIDHVALAVRDVEEAAKWYADVLGLERRYEGMWDGMLTFIGKGHTGIALFPRSWLAGLRSSRRSGSRSLASPLVAAPVGSLAPRHNPEPAAPNSNSRNT